LLLVRKRSVEFARDMQHVDNEHVDNEAAGGGGM
jgi:hypothetical protein